MGLKGFWGKQRKEASASEQENATNMEMKFREPQKVYKLDEGDLGLLGVENASPSGKEHLVKIMSQTVPHYIIFHSKANSLLQ